MVSFLSLQVFQCKLLSLCDFESFPSHQILVRCEKAVLSISTFWVRVLVNKHHWHVLPEVICDRLCFNNICDGVWERPLDFRQY